MRQLKWTSKSLFDLNRLYEFLEPVNHYAANKSVLSLTQAAHRLLENPRLGVRLHEFEPREVRRIIVNKYEIRYEIYDQIIYILNIWHTRENR